MAIAQLETALQGRVFWLKTTTSVGEKSSENDVCRT